MVTLGSSLLMRGKAMLLGAGKSAMGDVGKGRTDQPAKKKTIDSKKLLPSSSKTKEQHTISDEDVQNISIAATQLMDIDTILKGSLVLDKMRAKKENKAKEKKKRGLKEKIGEGIKNIGKGIKDDVQKAGEKAFDWINRLLFSVLLISLIKMADIIKPILPLIATMVDGFIMMTGWLFNAASTLIHWGYQIYDGIAGFVKNIFGEAGLKVFENLMSLLNNFANAAIMAVMALLKFKWLRNFAKGMVKRIGKLIMKIPGVKQIANIAKNIGGKALNFVKGVGGKVLGAGKKLLGAGKGIATKGAAKVGGFAVKIFGKAAKTIAPAFKAAKGFIGKFFGKVPIVGPLIIGVISLLAGEPAAQALFKAMGAALGGFLGSFIPIPILGTLIGETIGVFVGDLFYKLIFGGGLSAVGKALKDAFKGFFEPIFDFFRNGFSNFTENFPTFDIPDVGLQDLYIPILERIGLGKLLEFKIPGKVLGVKVPFVPEDGFSLGQMLDSLPKLPDILGWFARFIPGLNTYVEDGRLMRLPQIWQLANPIFMVKHLAQSFLPDMFGGPSSDNKSSSLQDKESGDDKEDKKKRRDRGLNKGKLVSYLKFKSAEKAAEEKKRKEQEAEEKGEKKVSMVKNIQTFMELPLDHTGDSPVAKETDSEDKSGSLSSYPSYDARSPQTTMTPMPPQVLPVGAGGDDSGGMNTSSGSGDDPFEAFYAHSGGFV